MQAKCDPSTSEKKLDLADGSVSNFSSCHKHTARLLAVVMTTGASRLLRQKSLRVLYYIDEFHLFSILKGGSSKRVPIRLSVCRTDGFIDGQTVNILKRDIKRMFYFYRNGSKIIKWVRRTCSLRACVRACVRQPCKIISTLVVRACVEYRTWEIFRRRSIPFNQSKKVLSGRYFKFQNQKSKVVRHLPKCCCFAGLTVISCRG